MIRLTVHTLREIDINGPNLPFVQLTPRTGVSSTESKKTKVGSKHKDDISIEEDVCFNSDEPDKCSFTVKLFFKGDDCDICYDGVGTIGPFNEPHGENNICVLYDNGDPDLPFGEVVYSWAAEAAAEDEENEQLNDANNPSANPADSVSPEDDSGIVDNELGDDVLNGEGETTSAGFPSPEPNNIPSPTMAQHNETKQSASLQYDPGYDEEFETLESPKDKKLGRSKSGKSKRPGWTKYEDYSRDIIESVQHDMADLRSATCSISLRVHSVLYTKPANSPSTTEKASGQVKLSVQPVPGTGNIVRSKASDESGENGVNFDFEMQPVNIAVSVADMRSKAYAVGACPRLQVEFTTGGFTAHGSMYLPELRQVRGGKMLVVNMQPSKSTRECTVTPWECPVTAGRATLLLQVMDDSLLQISREVDVGKAEALPYTAPPVDVNVHVIGIYGRAFKNIESCVVEASLSSSGVSCASDVLNSTFKRGIEAKYQQHMRSESSSLDILDIKVTQLMETSAVNIGMISIPLTAILKDGKCKGAYQSFVVEPPSQRGVNRVKSSEWAVVCEVSCDALDTEGLDNVEVSRSAVEEDLAVVDAIDSPRENDHIAKRIFEPVKSVSGELTVNAHGFIPKYGGTYTLTKSDMLSMDFTLPHSGSSKEKTEASRVCKYPEGVEDSPFCALWDKEFVIPIVWSLQQRHVGYLLGTLSCMSSKPKGTTDVRKHTVGYISLDIASVININNNPIVCVLPVVSALCSHENYMNCIGYVMVGLQFKQQSLDPAFHRPCQVSSGTKSVAWAGDTPHATTTRDHNHTQSIVQQPFPKSAFSDLKRLCIERWADFSQNLLMSRRNSGVNERTDDLVHMSFSLNSIVAVAGPLRSLKDDESVTVFISSNEPSVSMQGSIDIDTGKITLNNDSVALPVCLQSNTSILVCVQLVRDEDDSVIGVSSIVFPRDLLMTGKPMNVGLPLRNRDGLKVAEVICGCHVSSAECNAVMVPVAAGGEMHTMYELGVCVAEGNVWDGEWTQFMEPYFECTLTQPVSHCTGPDMRLGYDKLFDSTPIVDLNSVRWNAKCRIPIPDTATTSEGDVASKQLWTLSVRCRDALRLGCPVISHTQIAIPWSLLAKGRPIDQWVLLVSDTNGVSLIDDDDDEDESFVRTPESRLHIVVERLDKAGTCQSVGPHAEFPGVGQIATWYHSIREGESHREKVYPSADILSVEAKVEMVSSSGDLDENNGTIPFRSCCIETRQTMYIENQVADILSGHVAVPGGRSTTHLRVTRKHNQTPFLVSIPTMNTLPKPATDTPTTLSTEVPILDVVLRPDLLGNYTAAIKQRLSRLKLGAVFVPYVTGFLHIFHSNIEVLGAASDVFAGATSKPGALRYSLGGFGSCFSPKFTMKVSDCTGSSTVSPVEMSKSQCSTLSAHSMSRASKSPNATRRSLKKSGPQSPKKMQFNNSHKRSKSSKLRQQVTMQRNPSSPKLNNRSEDSGVADAPCIAVNTYDMLCGLGNSTDDIFDLRISLMDLESSGKNYCIAVGHLQTAAIYFQALRMIFAAQKEGEPRDFPTTLYCPVKLYNAHRVHVASVRIKLKFEMTSVPSCVVDFLRNYKMSLHAPPSLGDRGQGRAELGLKQAFVKADKDGSGGVTSLELVRVIESISTKSNKGDVVGFDEGAIDLLLGLMELVNGPPVDDSTAFSKERILNLFKAMDLDGDGTVSWWEWKQVLDGASAVMSNEPAESVDASAYVDPLDPLVVSVEAAHAALMALTGGIVRTAPRQCALDGDRPTEKSKKTKDLHEKIAKLRAKNSRLQQKLDEALSSSIIIDSNQSGSPQRAIKAEEQVREVWKLLKAEKSHRMQLEADLERIESSASEMVRKRSETELENLSMEGVLRAEADRLRKEMIVAFMSRKQRENSMNILQRFFFKVRERTLQRRIQKHEEGLARAMLCLADQKKYRALKRKRKNAAITIQSKFRYMLANRRVSSMRRGVEIFHVWIKECKLRWAAMEFYRKEKLRRRNATVKIQRAFRNYKYKSLVKYIKILQALCRGFIARRRKGQREKAALVIKTCFIRHYHMKKSEYSRRNDSARILQKFFRSKLKDSDSDDLMILHHISRPALEFAKGYWISHPATDGRPGDREREAIVKSVNMDTKLMTVCYLQETPTVEDIIHYDAPKITHWFRMCTPAEQAKEMKAVALIQAHFRGSRIRALMKPKQESALSVPNDKQDKAATKIQATIRGNLTRRKLSELSEDVDDVQLVRLDKPPPIERCPGYWVRRSDDTRDGLVDKVIRNTRVLRVLYDEDDDGIDISEVPYDEPNLEWYKDAEAESITNEKQAVDVLVEKDIQEKAATKIQAISRGRRDRRRVLQLKSGNDDEEDELIKLDTPPPIEACAGYWVVQSSDSDREGIVDKVNKGSRMLTVLYDSENGGVDTVIVPYDEPDLMWFK